MAIYSKNHKNIRITEERANHILTNHPEAREFFPQLSKIISDPDIIFQGEAREFIAAKRRKNFHVVVVYKEEKEDGFVITAFRARSLKYLLKRKIIWKKE